MAYTTFPTVTDIIPDRDSMLRLILRVLAGAMRGRTNNVRTVTLAANVGSTTVTLEKDAINDNTAFFFMPTTANAATELAAGTMYVSARSTSADPQTFTITHVNNAQTDRIFQYIMVG